MKGRMELRGKTAVITGAAGGIGRGIAEALARRGCHLALADVDTAGLAETAAALASSGLRISQHALDVADREAVAALPTAVANAHPGVDLLFNNAGVALGGTFEEMTQEDFEWLFGINFFGVVRMTRAFLPLLHASPDARIVNLSSLFGLISPAGQAAYSASKFAVRGFSNALRHELAESTVGVTVVHPGGVATKISAHARMAAAMPPRVVEQKQAQAKKVLRMPPGQAGEIIVEGVERREKRLLVTGEAKFISLLERLAPVRHADWFHWLALRMER